MLWYRLQNSFEDGAEQISEEKMRKLKIQLVIFLHAGKCKNHKGKLINNKPDNNVNRDQAWTLD